MLTPGAYDPRFMKPATLCRCGHILECCADCRDWLADNSARIERAWRFFTRQLCGTGAWPAIFRTFDAAEADNLAYFESVR